ncbi:NUDIX hydrolase [Streptomyces sp. NPDC002067]
MTVDAASLTRDLTDYLRHHPEELGPLMPLYDALRDHARRGRCPHRGRCPEVRAGALLCDERGRLLLLRYGGGWAFPEGVPVAGDGSLRESAYGLLREFGGVREAWALPGAEGPVLVDVGAADGGGVPRMRVGFRYLFAARAEAVPRVVLRTGLARWTGPEEVDGRIAGRVRAYTAAVGAEGP